MLELSLSTMSVEEYLACEQRGDVRHEYVNGYSYALAGGSSRHNRISLNIAAHFLRLAQDRPCRVYQEGMKLRTSERTFYYPNVMVVCGRDEPDPFFETEPCILVEVLSPSTQSTDLREKLTVYKSLPSVQTYLIVEAERLAVRHIAKGEDGRWRQQDLTGDGDIALPCLGGVLSLPQIYLGVFS
jgi:Uma2 family endonuclease